MRKITILLGNAIEIEKMVLPHLSTSCILNVVGYQCSMCIGSNSFYGDQSILTLSLTHMILKSSYTKYAINKYKVRYC